MIHPDWFHHHPPCPPMTDVRWRRTVLGKTTEGEGRFYLHWMGIEEVWSVFVTGGLTVHLYPEMGDTMEPIG